MNNETIRILASQMGESPDELIDVDRTLCEHEERMPDDVREALATAMSMIQTVCMDDTLSFGVRFGFLISCSANAIADNHGIPVSEFFTGMAASSLAAEHMMLIQGRIREMFFTPDPDAPKCQCGTSGRWCTHHERWECPNPLCPNNDGIEGE